jgi:phytoene dehydrogenase-like protein
MLTAAQLRPPRQPLPAARPHAVVIGSGFGGLAAAIRLGAMRSQVTVLERLDAPGGRACVFHQDGFTFDAGPTIITAPFLFEELWRLCGRRLPATSNYARLRHSTGSGSTTASDSTTAAIPRACGPRSPAFRLYVARMPEMLGGVRASITRTAELLEHLIWHASCSEDGARGASRVDRLARPRCASGTRQFEEKRVPLLHTEFVEKRGFAHNLSDNVRFGASARWHYLTSI